MPTPKKVENAINLELQPWDKFAVAMAPILTQFDDLLREHILIALYNRAWFRKWLEELRHDESKRPPLLREERSRGEQMRRKIEEAIRALREARVSAISGCREAELVQYAEILLNQAVEDLRFLEQLRTALIHPKLRNKTEKARRITDAPLESWTLFPGFGTAKVDHMFIGWLESYLSILRTKQGRPLSSPEINRITSAIFKAAFGERYAAERVRTARRRRRKEPTSPGQK